MAVRVWGFHSWGLPVVLVFLLLVPPGLFKAALPDLGVL